MTGIDSLLLDPAVEFVLVEADELADLQVVDSSLRDEASDESWADVEVVGSAVDVEEASGHRFPPLHGYSVVLVISDRERGGPSERDSGPAECVEGNALSQALSIARGQCFVRFGGLARRTGVGLKGTGTPERRDHLLTPSCGGPG